MERVLIAAPLVGRESDEDVVLLVQTASDPVIVVNAQAIERLRSTEQGWSR